MKRFLREWLREVERERDFSVEKLMTGEKGSVFHVTPSSDVSSVHHRRAPDSSSHITFPWSLADLARAEQIRFPSYSFELTLSSFHSPESILFRLSRKKERKTWNCILFILPFHSRFIHWGLGKVLTTHFVIWKINFVSASILVDFRKLSFYTSYGWLFQGKNKNCLLIAYRELGPLI
jgi:hypothetical protein